MKRPIHHLFLAAAILAVTACAKAEDAFYYDGESANKENPSAETEPGDAATAQQSFSFIATLHRTDDGDYYLQVDAGLRVYPANFGDLCHIEPDCPCRIVGEVIVFDRLMGDLGYYGLLDWFDFIEKGPFVPATLDYEDTPDGETPPEGNAPNGTDGVDVLADWMTTLEDGFLTLHIQTWWGFEPRRHEFRLVTGTNPTDPYELTLLHFANRDPKSFQADALVCYDLMPVLPLPDDPENTTVTLKWTNDAGQTQSRAFPYVGRY